MRKYISSDTNIWFDFYSISKIEFPFRLPYTYLMYYEAVRKEIIYPPDLINELTALGLTTTDIDTDEFFIAADINEKYRALSKYDSIALAIAKNRRIPLLTGDNALRKAAINEDVDVIGTIGIIDRLYYEHYVNESEYRCCLEGLLNNSGRRLPEDEIKKRLGK